MKFYVVTVTSFQDESNPNVGSKTVLKVFLTPKEAHDFVAGFPIFDVFMSHSH